LVNEDSKPKKLIFPESETTCTAGWLENQPETFPASIPWFDQVYSHRSWTMDDLFMSSEVLSARKASATAGACVWFPGFVCQKWREGRAF